MINFQTHLATGIDNMKDGKLSGVIIPDDNR